MSDKKEGRRFVAFLSSLITYHSPKE